MIGFKANQGYNFRPNLLNSHIYFDGVVDCMRWCPNTNGKFSPSSYYEYLRAANRSLSRKSVKVYFEW